MSRLRSSRDSDSQVKSGCSHLIRDGFTHYKINVLAPPIYFCYLFSFKSFTVPLGGPFLFEGGRGGEGEACVRACVRAWVNII